MVEHDIIYAVHALLKQMKVDISATTPNEGYTLAWKYIETHDFDLDPTRRSVDDLDVGAGTVIDDDQSDVNEMGWTPSIQIMYGLGGAQDRGLAEYLGFPDFPSLGILREMTPIFLRVVLFDDREGDTITQQISMAREDIRKSIGDELRLGIPSINDSNCPPLPSGRTLESIKSNLKEHVFQAWAGEYIQTGEDFYTDTVEFVIPIQVWWRYEQRAVDRLDTATTTEPRLPELSIEHTVRTEERTRETLEGDEQYTVILPDEITVTFELPSVDAELFVIKDEETPVKISTDGMTTGTWMVNRGEWTFDTVYQFRVNMDGGEAFTPDLQYPYYPSMLPESQYDEGSSPEQAIERKIRQEIEKYRKAGLRFSGINSTASGPLSLKYTRPENMPLICIEFKQTTLGFRIRNARDQMLECCAYVFAASDRTDSDPYKNIRIIDNALADLRVVLIDTEGLEGVSNAYQVVIGEVRFPRQAQDIGGDLLFMGSIDFSYQYRPGR